MADIIVQQVLSPVFNLSTPDITIQLVSPTAQTIELSAPSVVVDVSSQTAQISVAVTGPPGPSDHSLLTNLSGDDHTQYAIIDVTDIEPVAPRVGVIWVPEG